MRICSFGIAYGVHETKGILGSLSRSAGDEVLAHYICYKRAPRLFYDKSEQSRLEEDSFHSNDLLFASAALWTAFLGERYFSGKKQRR